MQPLIDAPQAPAMQLSTSQQLDPNYAAATSRLPATLLAVAVLASWTDMPSIPVGTVRLKVAYVVIPALFLASVFTKPSISRSNLLAAALFLVCLVPSFTNTHNALGSVAYFFGATVCAVAFLLAAEITKSIGPDRTLRILRDLCRFSVLATCALCLTGIQDRGHFLLYEPSYYAIALIPYAAVVIAGAIARRGLPLFDLTLLAMALVLTRSASMLVWLVLTFVTLSLMGGRRSWRKIVILSSFASIAVFALIASNPRAQHAAEVFRGGTAYAALVDIAGNRPQRMIAAYEVFVTHPVVGVGMNAFEAYSSANLDSADFIFQGVNASDFDVSTNAVNAYLEIAAETGAIGLFGYLTLIVFALTRSGHSTSLKAMKAALIVTSLALLVESSYLRPYVWLLYGIVVGLSSFERRDNGSHGS